MTKTAHLEWLPYEFRRVGSLGLTMPLVVAVTFLAVGGLQLLAGASQEQVGRTLTAGLEVGLPLAAGLVAATVVSVDPAVSLQLALPTRYRTTVLRRLALATVWTALIAIAWASLLWVNGLWTWPEPFLKLQLGWLAPLLWLVGLGALLTLLFQSRTASSAILGGLWLVQNVFYGLILESDWARPFFLFATTYTLGAEADYWIGNRATLVCTALVFLICVSLLLNRNESLDAGGDE